MVKKVVQFVIEALLESDKLDDLLIKVAKRIAIPGKVADVASGIKEKIGAVDDIDSTEDIAKMIIARGSGVDISGLSDSSEEIVSRSDGGNEDVMNILRNITD